MDLRVAGPSRHPPISSSTLLSTSPHAMSPPAQNAQPKYQGSLLSSQSSPQQPQRISLSKPNYNVSLSDIVTGPSQQPPPTAPFMMPTSQINPPHAPTGSALSHQRYPWHLPRAKEWAIFSRPSNRNIVLRYPGSVQITQAPKDILNDFDPLA
jgi:hypothetical protein